MLSCGLTAHTEEAPLGHPVGSVPVAMLCAHVALAWQGLPVLLGRGSGGALADGVPGGLAFSSLLCLLGPGNRHRSPFSGNSVLPL